MIATHGHFPVKRLLLLVLMFVAAIVTAQSNWQGTAVVGRFGEFPPGGLFASSNAFPLNTMVDVTNTTTGRTVRVIVVSRVSEAGVFMVLSDDAAEALQVSSGRGAVVRAEPVRLPGMTSVGPNQDLPFHRDPDINPAAVMGDPNQPFIDPLAREIAALTLPEEQPEAEPIAEAVPEEPEEELVLVVVPEPAVADVIPAVEAPPQEIVEDPLQRRLQELGELLQEDRLARVPEQAPPEAGLAPPPVPDIDLPMPVLPLATLSQPVEPVVVMREPVQPEEPIAVAPTHIPSEIELFLEPAEFRMPDLEPMEDLPQVVRDLPAPPAPAPPAPAPPAPAPPAPSVPAPPATAPAVAVPPAAEPTADSFPLVQSLQRGAYYVQVAALTSEEGVRRAVDRLNGNVGLPVSVLPLPGQDRTVYRIVVGPLQDDERGATLFLLRNQGFRDAFIRQE